MVKGTHIFDIDGTIVEFHTNKWLPNAKETIRDLFFSGSIIIFVTMRGVHDAGTEWSIERTKETILKDLDDMGIKYNIIFGVPSPRTLHDDSEIFLDKRIRNQNW